MTYKYIFVDLDDPTIILQRFHGNVKTMCKDNNTTLIRMFGCSNRDTDKIKQNCATIGVEFMKKPLTVDTTRHLIEWLKHLTDI